MPKLPLAKFEGGYEAALQAAVMDGVITVLCPHCGCPRGIEPDGYYDDIECEACKKHYRTAGVC